MTGSLDCSPWTIFRIIMAPAWPAIAFMLACSLAITILVIRDPSRAPQRRYGRAKPYAIGVGILLFVLAAQLVARSALIARNIDCRDFYSRIDRARQSLPWTR